MRTLRRLLPIAGFLALLCCGNEDTMVLPTSGSTTVDLRLGQEKTLTTAGESSKVIKIKFRDLREGRCAEQNCPSCYGGYVHTYFDISVNNAQDSLHLTRISCVKVENPNFEQPVALVDRAEVLGLRIGLARITDYTGNNDKKNYSVQLLISTL